MAHPPVGRKHSGATGSEHMLFCIAGSAGWHLHPPSEHTCFVFTDGEYRAQASASASSWLSARGETRHVPRAQGVTD